MSHIEQIAAQLGLRLEKVAATVDLLDVDNKIAFIARYRKEITGGMDEEQLRHLSDLLKKLRLLDERRQTIFKSIEEQGKLTPQLKQQLLQAETLTELEDLYQPYKPKRRTRASVARERGLQPLADLILEQPRFERSLLDLAQPYLTDEVPTVEEAWAGSRDIVAEIISDHAEVRQGTRLKATQWGVLRSEKQPDAADEKRTYETYYEFAERVDRLRPHKVLALNRGEAEKVLRLSLDVAERDWQGAIAAVFHPDPRSPLAEQLTLAVNDAAQRLLLPAIERDVRRALTEQAEQHAIGVFADNLRALLNQPPLSGHTVLGIDPGFRTGCKTAVVDPTGKVLETDTIYPHPPQNQREHALKTLADLVERHKISLVTIGNGTGSRETEQLVAELTRANTSVHYLIVNEAGASVYSASPLARAEMPDLDVSMRGAVSIARRAQDPLAELVKIDPKSIGVGLYQHDVDQKALTESLNGVVESVVNNVGVDINTASAALLTYVAGIGPRLAERIVAYRDEKGSFTDRETLHQVPGLGPKAFEQSAGFLRIHGGSNPLDATAIHPESYPVAQTLFKKAGLNLQLPLPDRRTALDALRTRQPMDSLAAQLGTGVPTLSDIFEQLLRPARDPREDVPLPILRSDVLSIEDLKDGMRLKGTVRNVVDFGAFIDIGVKQDGLLHRSQLAPGTALKVGDVIDVIILKVETERGRISLGMAAKE
ncbi:MAG: RNA-binding transcriptional accessory protein [Anaerolineales bacterium]|nr:RNA-binding transcriptional accessory protein [Anaerolineales bacterium]